jgi:hypothetical protein
MSDITEILFPNWVAFAGVFLFLRIFNPMRLYLDRTSSLAISIVMGMVLQNNNNFDYEWLLTGCAFALWMSVPYWLGGMLGGLIQQLLLLNEQSVQDGRFTEESEAISKLSSLCFLMFCLDNGVLFRPFIDLIAGDFGVTTTDESFFTGLYGHIVNYMAVIFVVFGKYLILLVAITVCCGMVDLFFKKASLSLFVSPNVKAIVVVIILCLWFLDDQRYMFNYFLRSYT